MQPDSGLADQGWCLSDADDEIVKVAGIREAPTLIGEA
jgi:hypothetical protein